ncbi:MAG: peptidylprolyl isomerase [Parabacteroides sp.]|nr:peptidylprolyl isomerase [Parabacteroides sp.]
MTNLSETKVVMHTTLGDITLKLYNETPKHRDNFLKLVNDGTYNGLLFHRVIKEFMVQGGDVTSKDAPMNKQLGAGDLGYTVPAEFVYPKYFHKKGALCAARTGDEVNPEKASSASQFYIVTGKKYSDSELKQMEKQLENRLKQSIFARLQAENKSKIMELYRSGDKAELAILRDTLIGKTELEAEKRKDEAKLTEEQKEIYKTVGGVPFLDNQYTVYGEVVDGMEVVEKIEKSKTNRQDRPTENISIISVEVLAQE